jgi:hypothetical protein
MINKITLLQVHNYEIVVNFIHISHNLRWYSEVVHKFTIFYPVCSTFELIKQFIEQSISKRITFIKWNLWWPFTHYKKIENRLWILLAESNNDSYYAITYFILRPWCPHNTWFLLSASFVSKFVITKIKRINLKHPVSRKRKKHSAFGTLKL